ncbi:MAG TPA: histidine--tRNA ligase [Syntrophomonadaceae bacterium]|nr:histidine--tRNA ligase [Syntrophomonadaceae bacterium]
MRIEAPRGTIDILPPDSFKWHYMENILTSVAEIYGYHEIRTPIFEHTELFERGVGETTDVVSKEMYTFTDKAGRSITLRPEATATCARALIEHGVYAGALPVKWYYMGPMFRYDRPQTARYRQFTQFGVEVFGSNSPYLDAEVIILLLDILNRLGLKEYELHLNSVGCPECRQIYRDKLIKHITPAREKLCQDCQARYNKNPLRVLDCKIESCQNAIAGYPAIIDSLCENCKIHYETVKQAITDNNIEYIHDDNLVRGLDYYTNTAFEIHIPGIGAQSAIGGGGRYNGLVEACGGPDVPGVGFALGLERILLALESKNVQLVDDSLTDVFIIVSDLENDHLARQLTSQLRSANIRTDKDYADRSMRAQMKHANRLGAKITIIIGEDEVKNHYFTVRDMAKAEQSQVLSQDIVNHIKNILGKG